MVLCPSSNQEGHGLPKEVLEVADEKWQEIVSMNDEAIKDILREEGISEDELEAEVEKLKENQLVQGQVRSVLITPEVDKTLRWIFALVKMNTVDSDNNEYLKKTEEAIWPR